MTMGSGFGVGGSGFAFSVLSRFSFSVLRASVRSSASRTRTANEHLEPRTRNSEPDEVL
jgi:hypothetical protein